MRERDRHLDFYKPRYAAECDVLHDDVYSK